MSMASGKRLLETVGEHVREHRSGMFVDLVFAIAWVTVVTVVFDLLPGGPQWLYYLTLLGGVVAYFGFFASLEAVRGGDE
ncbi:MULTISPECIES: hypothetical protein [Haloarcula]|uniref:DUF8119 domain-containing protein n=1 Tax=Haloarcula pellucida TaxID=1427151 RepID=A0A830GLE3_9EURY|nr:MULTISPECIES: hypothetical protein [Halomicroarcula]MDS0278534.1 hypothetical protein [Halomicroarcula sp. S1AR25-4]GGN91889.1 hypothetical protein GCM10009030_15430 [Halomicroarcula pellucida]